MKPCPTPTISQELLSKITARKRAMIKLQIGVLPLTEEETDCVLAEKRAEAAQVKSRTLREVAAFFGITRERVRQINERSMRKLQLSPQDTQES